MSTSTSKRGRNIAQPLGPGPGAEQCPLFEEGEFTPKSNPTYKGTELASGVQ